MKPDLMEEMVAKQRSQKANQKTGQTKKQTQFKAQRAFASIFFIATVVAGMQIATQQVSRAQVNPTAISPPTPTAKFTGVGTADAVPAGPAAAPYLPPQFQNNQSQQGSTNGAPTNQLPTGYPNGPGGPSEAIPMNGNTGSFPPPSASSSNPLFNSPASGESYTPKPTATPPVPFVPSEVERYVPGTDRVGDPRAIMRTSLGDITIRLFSDRAPRTVHNFIDLARGERDFVDARTSKHTHRPFFSDLTFFRVLAPYLIQTGCPFGTGRGGPGYTIPDEISRVLTFDKPGMVAMAPERGPKGPIKDSNGSQFFISLQPMPTWNGQYTIFGEVERGMSIVQKIANTPTGPTDRPIRKVYLKQVEIIDEATAKLMPASR